MSDSDERVALLETADPQYSTGVGGLAEYSVPSSEDAVALHENSGPACREDFDSLPPGKRQLGLTSAVFLIVNRIIGTGIYATPSAILKSCGSVGLSIAVWTLGALIAAAGTAVFVELGTGLPRNGGEKNYLEFIYRRPKFLISYVYAVLVVLIGWSAASTVLLGEYVVHALDLPLTRWNARFVGAIALTATFLLHGTRLKWGLLAQNTLGIFTLLVMIFIILTGLAVFISPSILPADGTERLHWDNLWTGSQLEPNAFASAIYNVIWCFNGYSNANYALSEVRDPVRTIKRAAPLALLLVTTVYLFTNLSYFAVISKAEMLQSGRIVAGLFFRKMFGPRADRIVSLVISLSLLANMLALQFTQARVIQELGREGILPYSSWFASDQPFNSPFNGLAMQWFASLVVATMPPPGDAFNFILQANSYATVVINVAVSAGLLFLHSQSAQVLGYGWLPPFQAWTSTVAFFFFSNVFLAIVPLIPPSHGHSIYEHIPYFLHTVVVLGLALFGAICYYVRCVYLPRRRGYVLVREFAVQNDGISRNVFRKVRVE